MMSEKLDWTQKLGDAFLAQQKEVMDTVQKLRFKAKEAGNLKTTQEQKVIVQEKVIIVEPASPQVIYVPAYNPVVVYGVWRVSRLSSLLLLSSRICGSDGGLLLCGRCRGWCCLGLRLEQL